MVHFRIIGNKQTKRERARAEGSFEVPNFSHHSPIAQRKTRRLKVQRGRRKGAKTCHSHCHSTAAEDPLFLQRPSIGSSRYWRLNTGIGLGDCSKESHENSICSKTGPSTCCGPLFPIWTIRFFCWNSSMLKFLMQV